MRDKGWITHRGVLEKLQRCMIENSDGKLSRTASRLEAYQHFFEDEESNDLSAKIVAKTTWKRSQIPTKFNELFSVLSDRLHYKVTDSGSVVLSEEVIPVQSCVALKLVCEFFDINAVIEHSPMPVHFDNID
jgi:hypothetical protein